MKFLLYLLSGLLGVAVGYFINQLPNLPDHLKPWVPAAIAVLIVVIAFVTIQQEKGNAASAQTIALNERTLLNNVKQEVSDRLRQSLHNAVLLNLDKQAQPDKLKRPWDSEIKIGAHPVEPIPPDKTILQVFDRPEINGNVQL